jgi:hypothetical protein
MGADDLARSDVEAARAERDRLDAELRESREAEQRLLAAYVQRALSVEEFRDAKNAVVAERQKVQAARAACTSQASGWLEPFRRFVKTAQAATSVAEEASVPEIAKFFKSLGSNLTLRDRRLKWSPRGAWQVVVGQEVVEMGGSLLPEGESGKNAETREQRIQWSRGESNPRADAVNPPPLRVCLVLCSRPRPRNERRGLWTYPRKVSRLIPEDLGSPPSLMLRSRPYQASEVNGLPN